MTPMLAIGILEAATMSIIIAAVIIAVVKDRRKRK